MKAAEFQVIPVLDIRERQAVRAVAGNRAAYAPLSTPLAPDTADPVAIAAGYRQLYPFSILYLADLDGIERHAPGIELHASVAAAWISDTVGSEVWVDDGTMASHPMANVVRVIGSESAGSADVPQDRNTILSLDFRGATFIGDPRLLDATGLWPRRVIVMTLARVGMGGGPDFARLGEIIGRAGASRQVYAAGGVRNRDDLERLRDLGAAGALVATALHNGQIKTGDLEEIAGSSFQSTSAEWLP